MFYITFLAEIVINKDLILIICPVLCGSVPPVPIQFIRLLSSHTYPTTSRAAFRIQMDPCVFPSSLISLRLIHHMFFYGRRIHFGSVHLFGLVIVAFFHHCIHIVTKTKTSFMWWVVQSSFAHWTFATQLPVHW
jgi:hypothetical protein